jgi:hypothetical protein
MAILINFKPRPEFEPASRFSQHPPPALQPQNIPETTTPPAEDMAIPIDPFLLNGGAPIESKISNLEGNNMNEVLNGGAPIESHISNLDIGDMSSSEGASTQQLSAVAAGKQKVSLLLLLAPEK